MQTSYQQQFGHLPDFDVTYRLFPLGSSHDLPVVYQGTRWDFMYDDKAYRDGLFGIYPEITSASTGKIFPMQQPIPEYGIATMWIANSRLRHIHQQRISVGTRGYWMEGNRKVAVCEVVRIIDLFSNPTL